MKARVLVFGNEIVATKFRRMGHDMLSAEPAFEEIADYLIDITSTQFESQGRRGGGSWKRLSPRWLAFKQRRGFDTRILHMSTRNTLRRSVTRRNAPQGIMEITRDSLNFGSSVEYAARHQYGVPGRTPARPFIRILPQDEKFMTIRMSNHLMQAWRKTR